MKILHFIPSIDRSSGGVGSYIQLLAKELGKLCDLYIATEKSEHQLSIENAHILTIPSHWTQYYTMKRIWKKLLNELQPDLVHVNCCWMPQCAWAQRWSQKAGYKVILSTHGMLAPWIMQRHYWTRKKPALWLFQKQALIKADYLHATSDYEKLILEKLNYNNKIEIVPNCVDVDKISIKSNWKRNKTILFLARIHVTKGLNFLLDAVAILKEELKDYTIKVVGEGDEKYVTHLKQKTYQMGISNMVQFYGGVYGEQKWNFFREADLFVLPTHTENFGIVVAEALACGTPVITTKGTPWKELNTEHCGWWIEIGTDATKEALLDFLSKDSKTLKEMGIKGRELINNKYSCKIVSRKMYELYQKVIINL